MIGTVGVVSATALAVTLVVFLPVMVAVLHRLWRAARSIQLNTRDAVPATKGIADNIASIALLDQTVETSTTIVRIASAIEQQLRTRTELRASQVER